MRIIFLFLILALGAGGAAAEGCVINGQTMVCPKGVIIGGIGQSVFFGNKALNEGTGERRSLDSREVHEFGNSGVIIGGQGEAERMQ
ncbi:MAG: hypothetical protein ACLPID_14005 [Beijerinckiaceae bacterium]